MDDKDRQIAELENRVESLKKRLAETNSLLLVAQMHLRRQQQVNHDSLPYPEDDDR